MAGRLQGQVAIITGASRGLGEYCALAFAREGAKVAVAARSVEEKDPRLPGTIFHTARSIEEIGGEALPVACNVADADSIQAMAERVLDRWGRIDILMNNAAIQPPGGNADISPKHWELQYRVNVHGAFHCVRSVLPTMLEQRRGSIVNISSNATQGGSPYGGTKRAVEAMTQGLARELAGQGIAANVLKPLSIIETPGYLFAQVPRDELGDDIPEIPPPDSYVEAAILLALQTPDTFTGRVHNDAEVIGLLADERSRERFRALNPDYWSASMDSVG
ncbi:MAG: SDR family oxidoreductase [Pseudomonadales bacterium]|jgi:NAD(P)-dependent dehydrogenase (short-subunit alcohol dehydrogenase family)|nr:SDR family oxidoreductase [Pseudomonadales bacterium]MDP6471128.1 SDR family oxidoreductase [Pseudomonadales bacterium]MDP6825686.1 SDR family oxidoreductase [Pseudomonadales bacterium]MDP6973142.1 SDR family oxidoreductase [Pseudomonadales bacterium]|tara:strand:+ start:838 stop:1668 length:831 start_codon:yes stop_codon:yes gene_type:complete